MPSPAVTSALERLPAPPIVEVVCGVRFERLPLDPLLLGAYWEPKRTNFPRHELHPPIYDRGPVTPEYPFTPRVWLVSESGEFLLQIQADRFYVNWRKGEGDYPRFSDHPQSRGVLSRVIEEFEGFADFCKRAIGISPVLERVELTKIDAFRKGLHWKNLADLVQMLPILSGVRSLADSEDPIVNFQMSHTIENTADSRSSAQRSLRSELIHHAVREWIGKRNS